MGLFETGIERLWRSSLLQVSTLLLYTDGITEAANADGQEFGESRLQGNLVSHSHLRAGSVLPQDVPAVVRPFERLNPSELPN